MKPRSLTQRQRQVLLHFLEAAQDQRRTTLGEIAAPGESWRVVDAFDELLDMGLLRVEPTVRLEIRAEMFGRFSDESAEVQAVHKGPEKQTAAPVVGRT